MNIYSIIVVSHRIFHSSRDESAIVALHCSEEAKLFNIFFLLLVVIKMRFSKKLMIILIGNIKLVNASVCHCLSITQILWLIFTLQTTHKHIHTHVRM